MKRSLAEFALAEHRVIGLLDKGSPDRNKTVKFREANEAVCPTATDKTDNAIDFSLALIS